MQDLQEQIEWSVLQTLKLCDWWLKDDVVDEANRQSLSGDEGTFTLESGEVSQKKIPSILAGCRFPFDVLSAH
jgi:hypothetical protein